MTQEFVTLPRAVVEQAMNAWQTASYGQSSHHKAMLLAMTALRAALEQPQVEQEPVGKLISDPYEGHIFVPYGDRWPFSEDLYTHPQPKIEPLDGGEIHRLWDEIDGWFNFARAIEAAHNIK